MRRCACPLQYRAANGNGTGNMMYKLQFTWQIKQKLHRTSTYCIKTNATIRVKMIFCFTIHISYAILKKIERDYHRSSKSKADLLAALSAGSDRRGLFCADGGGGCQFYLLCAAVPVRGQGKAPLPIRRGGVCRSVPASCRAAPITGNLMSRKNF